MTTMIEPATTSTRMSDAPDGPVTVRFVEPLPGFEQHEHFELVPIDPEGVLVAMRALTEPGLRFVLTPAGLFFPDYAPRFDAGVADSLGVSQRDLRVLLVLTVTGDLAGATANLRAPIVLAVTTATALQVVLDEPALSMRAPILPSMPPGNADLA